MKKVFFTIASLAVISLVSCNTKDVKVDTSGAIPAKVINTVDETTEITVSVDTAHSSEVVPPETAEVLLNEEIEKENQKQQTDTPEE